MSNTYKSIAAVCPRPSVTEDTTQDIDDSLQICLDRLESQHTKQKARVAKKNTKYPNKERSFLFDELFDDLIDKYVDNGFLTKNNRVGFLHAILPHIKIEKRKQHMQDDINIPVESEQEEF